MTTSKPPAVSGIVAVICTTGSRRKELFEALESIENQTVVPDKILIIDQSPNGALSATIKNEYCGTLKTECIQSQIQSLSQARNTAASHVRKSGQWALFLDDDVVLDCSFISSLCQSVLRHGEARVVFGNIQNNWSTPSWYNKVAPLLGLKCHGRGVGFRVLKSSKSTMDINPCDDTPADWATGCAFMVRPDVLGSFGFDDKMMGYCLGEDSDYSFRVAKAYPGSVICVSGAKLLHNRAAAGRLAKARLARMRTLYGYYIFCKNRDLGFSRIWFWGSELLFTVSVAFAALLGFRDNPYPLGAHLQSYWGLRKHKREIEALSLSGANKYIFEV